MEDSRRRLSGKSSTIKISALAGCLEEDNIDSNPERKDEISDQTSKKHLETVIQDGSFHSGYLAYG
jgi:hypothetical protein